MSFAALLRGTTSSHPIARSFVCAAALLGASLATGCSPDLLQVVCEGDDCGQVPTGGAGGTGGTGGATTSTSTSTSTSTTTSTTATIECGNGICEPGENSMNCSPDCPGGDCGNGICEPGENSMNCSPDCPAGACAHDVCAYGDPLQSGCSDCVTMICAQEASCCAEFWHGGCIGLANQLCGNLCCGDGFCAGESCNDCTDDCGNCPPPPTCPHTVCFGDVAAEPLNTTDCYDPCIDEVCATIDETTDNCCDPEPPSWSAECTDKAKMLCPEYTCIKDVCATMPSCCTANWTTACVDLVKTTASCNTQCDCAHGPCSDGQALTIGCNPCVDAICEADPYCCNNNWDGICVGEVATLCGIDCN